MSLDILAPRRAITTPRDLALPGRVLSSALALLDRVNPFPVSQPVVLELSDEERDGLVAAFLAYRQAIWQPFNTARRAEWRLRFGGAEPTGPMLGVTVGPKAARLEGKGFQLKPRPTVEEQAPAPANNLHQLHRRPQQGGRKAAG